MLESDVHISITYTHLKYMSVVASGVQFVCQYSYLEIHLQLSDIFQILIIRVPCIYYVV